MIRPEVFGSSIAVALVLSSFLAWRWRINRKIAIPVTIVIGTMTAGVTHLVELATGALTLVALIPFEMTLVVLMASMAILVRFYGDPERVPDEVKNVIISPVDGRVIYVHRVDNFSALVSKRNRREFRLEEITAASLANKPGYLIGIGTKALDVHVNRAPIAGTVLFRRHIHGELDDLRKTESGAANGRVTTVIGNASFSVGVIQMASPRVRGVVSYINQGDPVQIAQRIGAVMCGSNLDLMIPEIDNLRVTVKPGSKVKAGTSVIAKYGRE